MEWDEQDDLNGMDENLNSVGYSLLPEPGMILLQERICSISGSKFFPVRDSSQINERKWRSPFHSPPLFHLNCASLTFHQTPSWVGVVGWCDCAG